MGVGGRGRQEKVKIPQDLSHLKIMSVEEVETIGAEPDNSKDHVITLSVWDLEGGGDGGEDPQMTFIGLLGIHHIATLDFRFYI